ncbi:MAG TPA: undecaprenyl-diphosphate phosphatase [Anaerolineae bacterium]|nr:undecaprenyl-diphosphate phosphatase [Anaerolineae bacterium]HOG45216.1 undecaprenyl-diphosphate phosphatase [Anaerolineae bacterium]HOQ98511.1 undecaprenyl-diphosphate phosphatase [Anaerolineae bacterium]HOQ98534.1 undecaprenyl-diphosphate phosphatase [Anaerolineae bacterium]HPL29779.1 undecaprenyl-diphosphate phosphatase [Anaerolineae bacterium]
MSLLQAVILGLVQGLTEFIPVSSSGHLVLVPWLFGWANPGLAFDAVLHLGTLVAVLAVFWRDWLTLAADWFASLRRRSVATADVTGVGRPVTSQGATAVGQSAVAWALIVGTIPAVILGLAAEDFFESLFSSPGRVSALLLVTALILWAGERWAGAARRLEAIGLPQALLIGLAQGLAIAPGISRSGATMAAGRVAGFSREDAARFSFLLATPVIAGAGGLALLKLVKAGGLQDALPLAVGFLVAAVSGYLVIRFLLSYLRRHSLLPFAAYCAVAGVLGIVLTLVR